MTWMTATLGPKGQITLPKRVREVLGMKEAGMLVGFIFDEKTDSVKLTRMEVRPAREDYTEEELRKIQKLALERGGKKFASAEEFLRHIQKL